MGGLGNYLFQIASAYSKSVDDNSNFFIDKNDITIGHSNPEKYKTNIFRKMNFQTPIDEYFNYLEPHFNYAQIQNFGQNTKMIGYFQSEKYFIKNKNKILNLFNIDEETKTYLNKKYGVILKNKTCSLHVRRGDYVRLNQYHTVLPIEYYEKSINIIGDDYHFLIFSDDLGWCEKNLFFIKNKTFIVGNDDYQDLYLMTMCENNIIANSSFSWWGAWMNNNENKKIISPKLWFGPLNKHLNTDDLYCEKWIKI